MRIAFDGTALRPGRTGVGYYTEHLLHHLARIATNDELIVLSNRAIDTTAPLPPRVRVATPPRRVPRLVWMQTLASTALRQVDADVVHFTNGMLPLVSPAPTVVTIHDMSLRLYPRYHPPRRVLLNRPLVDMAARRGDAMITPSEGESRDIVRIYDLHPAGERTARLRPLLRPRSAPRPLLVLGGRAVVPPRQRSGATRAGAAAL